MDRRVFAKTLAFAFGAGVGHGTESEKVRIDLTPAPIAEFDKEDEFESVLGGADVKKADDSEAEEMIEQFSLELPRALDCFELIHYAQQHKTSGGLQIPPDEKRYSFHLVEIPLTVISTGKYRLVRLRLVLKLEAKGAEVVAYDVFPPPDVEVKKLLSGEVNLDISKALKFVLTSVGAAAAAPVTDSLGFKLNLPFQWNTTSVKLQSSGRMSNPVQWYVSDDSILRGFAPSAIVRARRGAAVTVRASLAGEIRRSGPRGWIKSQFQSSKERIYVLSGG
jgi:hypothetical protein